MDHRSTYRVKLCDNKPPKIWGIDPMSTPLGMAIVRLYSSHKNQDKEEGKQESKGFSKFRGYSE